jgi:lysophospholipase L1-like esterase
VDQAPPSIRYYDMRPKRRWLGMLTVGLLLASALGVGLLVGARWWDSRSASAEVAVLEPRLPAGVPALGADQGADAGGSQVDLGDTDALQVAMIGDSITNGSRAELEYVLTAQGVQDVSIEAEDGRRIELGDGTGSPLSGQRALYSMLASGMSPDVWVIALGTNDAGQYADQADYARLVQLLVDMVPDGVPLVWVDVYRGDQPEGSQQFDDALRATLAGRADTVVVPWSTIAADPTRGVLRSDDVHPNQDGRAVFATVVAQGVAEVT